MAQTLGLRATSFVASALLLGFGVLAALSVSVTLQTIELTPPDAIDVYREQPPPPARPPSRPRVRPPQAPVDDPVISAPFPADPLPPEAPTETSWQPPSVGPQEITNPRWLRRPANLGPYFPSRALAREITGQVMLDCLVGTDGALACQVISETPTGWGFGAAALRIARDHRMAPATRDGVAVEGRYRMRVPFEVR
jgi:periplasmic protein TonB